MAYIRVITDAPDGSIKIDQSADESLVLIKLGDLSDFSATSGAPTARFRWVNGCDESGNAIRFKVLATQPE